MSHSSPPTGCPFHAAQNRATATDSPRPANGTPAAGVVPDPATVLAATRLWVEKAVVGLNLCPFANAVLKKERLHIQVSEATEPLALLEDLRTELKRLLDAPETEIETSLLVCPRMLSDFLEFNDFLDMAEALLTELDLNGTVQIASFHPHYQFAGTAVDDIENAAPAARDQHRPRRGRLGRGHRPHLREQHRPPAGAGPRRLAPPEPPVAGPGAGKPR